MCITHNNESGVYMCTLDLQPSPNTRSVLVTCCLFLRLLTATSFNIADLTINKNTGVRYQYTNDVIDRANNNEKP